MTNAYHIYGELVEIGLHLFNTQDPNKLPYVVTIISQPGEVPTVEVGYFVGIQMRDDKFGVYERRHIHSRVGFEVIPKGIGTYNNLQDACIAAYKRLMEIKFSQIGA